MRISVRFEWPADRQVISYLNALPARKRAEGLRSLVRIGALIREGRIALMMEPIDDDLICPGDTDNVNLHLQRPLDDLVIVHLETLSPSRQRALIADLAAMGVKAQGNYQRFEPVMMPRVNEDYKQAHSPTTDSTEEPPPANNPAAVVEDYFDVESLDLDAFCL